MPEATQTMRAEPRATTFTCHTADAKSVFLAGTFNNWDPFATPMQDAGEGEWSVELPLAAGLYEYKFVVDGEWCCEPGLPDQDLTAPDCVANAFGTMNLQIHVP